MDLVFDFARGIIVLIESVESLLGQKCELVAWRAAAEQAQNQSTFASDYQQRRSSAFPVVCLQGKAEVLISVHLCNPSKNLRAEDALASLELVSLFTYTFRPVFSPFQSSVESNLQPS